MDEKVVSQLVCPEVGSQHITCTLVTMHSFTHTPAGTDLIHLENAPVEENLPPATWLRIPLAH